MRKRIILYIATSLDGFIARKNGSVDWLSPYENGPEDYGYNEFYKKIGTVIMGNTTYKQVLSFGDFPYKGKDCFVFTKNKDKLKDSNVTFVSKSVKDFISQLNLRDNENVWLVGGASIIDEFLMFDLIDEFIITTIPILLGDGIHLFNGKLNEKRLKLIDVKSFNSGLVQLHYTRKECV
ncbi:MAG: Dihydrofolate reductase [Candidatus Methanocomedens sp.]|nr:MAG: Dihydrofolate reductase [ANME-2 cluster archaeon]KAF5424025.1 MAG: Dihydrofolate reductase [ANME-2 cluster archaeon]